MAAAAVAKKVNTAPRGSDRKKVEKQWKDVKVVQEYDDGWYLGFIDDPADLATLGKLMGHCSGTHWIWACEERIWYFFALFDKDDVPHGTLHAKEKKWLDKEHPRELKEIIPVERGGVVFYCPTCNGNGGAYRGNNYDNFERCVTCKGSGRDPNPPKKPGKLIVLNQVGPYPTYQDVVAAFERAGMEYEPGKYRPLNYNSRVYDSGAKRDSGEGVRNSFDYQYGNAIPNKPDGVSDELWAQYTKVFKSLKDEFDKNNGFVKIAGRTFKFDGKDLIVLSFSDKSHSGSKTTYRKQIAEFLNNHQKAKKKEETT